MTISSSAFRTIVVLVCFCFTVVQLLALPNNRIRSIRGGGSHKGRFPTATSTTTLILKVGGGGDNYSDDNNVGASEDANHANVRRVASSSQQPHLSNTVPSQSEPSLEEMKAAPLPTTTGVPTAKGKSPGWFRQKFPNLPYRKFPDYLTYARCAAIPLLCVAFYSPGRHIEAGLLFASASVTDWLDGFLARRWDVSTPFGAFLDPVADKLMVSTALILLSGRHGAIVAVPSSIILARELAVSALREWMAQRGQRDAVKVGMQGKVKTALTMVALTLMLLVPDVGKGSWMSNLLFPSLVSLYVCAIITVTSGSVYFRSAAPLLRGD